MVYYYLPDFLRLSNFFLLFCCCCCFSTMINPTSAAAGQPAPTTLVTSVCRNTTNYTFCVESLYSDPRTPTADRYVLAYVAFDLAYLNATRTKAYVESLLNATATAATKNDSRLLLMRCNGYYGEAVSAIGEALNDLDSETFSEPGPLAAVAASKARDCESALKRSHSPSPLSKMNGDLRRLCKICIIISNLFT